MDDNPPGAERIAPDPPGSAVGARRDSIVVTKIPGSAEVYLERLLTLFRTSTSGTTRMRYEPTPNKSSTSITTPNRDSK